MAFIKSILFVAFIAAVAAQLDMGQVTTIQEQAQQQLQNATAGGVPGGENLPVDQDQLTGQLPGGSTTSEAPATEASRWTDRITNGVNGIRGSRRHH